MTFDFTGDQYTVDTESRYPTFSDLQTSVEGPIYTDNVVKPRVQIHNTEFELHQLMMFVVFVCVLLIINLFLQINTLKTELRMLAYGLHR